MAMVSTCVINAGTASVRSPFPKPYRSIAFRFIYFLRVRTAAAGTAATAAKAPPLCGMVAIPHIDGGDSGWEADKCCDSVHDRFKAPRHHRHAKCCVGEGRHGGLVRLNPSVLIMVFGVPLSHEERHVRIRKDEIRLGPVGLVRFCFA